MLCTGGDGEGVGEGEGICIPGMLCIGGVGEGDAAREGDDIGTSCRCCALTVAINNDSNSNVSTIHGNEVSTIRVSGWVNEASWDLVCDMSIENGARANLARAPKGRTNPTTDWSSSSCLSCCTNRRHSSIRVCQRTRSSWSDARLLSCRTNHHSSNTRLCRLT